MAFGIDIDCISNPNESFRKYGKLFFEPSLGNSIRALISFVFPALMRPLNIKTISQEIEKFIFSMVQQSLDYREKSKVTRKDFFQLLVQLRNTGNVQSDGEWDTQITNDESNKTLSFEEVAAQTFLFLIAGFETSSSTMSYCLYELARAPEYQWKVQQEIDDVLMKHSGLITYESVSEMHLLKCCIDGKASKKSMSLKVIYVYINRNSSNASTIADFEQRVHKGLENSQYRYHYQERTLHSHSCIRLAA